MSVVTITESKDEAIVILAGPAPLLSTMLLKANNLFDLPNPAAARGALGLGDLALLGTDIFASSSNYIGNTAGKLVTCNAAWGAALPLQLGGAVVGTVTLDLSLGINFQATLGGNITLANPINVKNGQSGGFFWSQGSAAGRTVSFGNNWYPTDERWPTFSTVATAANYLSFQIMSGVVCFSGGRLTG